MLNFIKRRKVTILTSFLSGTVGAIVVLTVFLSTNKVSLNTPEIPNTGIANSSQAQNVLASAGLESAIIDVVKKAEPAVLSIAVKQDLSKLDLSNDSFIYPLKRLQGEESENGKIEIGSGSAFFITKDGLAVTNKHVVSDETTELTAIDNDGKEYEVEVVAVDPILDVALIRIKGNNFQFLEFETEPAEVGSTAIAIGNTLGEFQNTVSVGVVSGVSRTLVASNPFGGVENLDDVIQTDAAINPGNSGGPLLSSRGKVIGVNVAVVGGGQSVGFAIPAPIVAAIAKSVEQHGRIIRPYLGVRYIPITEEVRDEYKLNANYGALVKSNNEEEKAVVKGSPADKAGIAENDIILEIDGLKLDRTNSLSNIIRSKKVGDTIKLKTIKNGNEKTIDVKLAELKL